LFEKFVLPRANADNLSDWLNSIDGWIGSYINSLSKLRSEALELLLRSEEQVKEMHQTQMIKAAPLPSSISTDYSTFTPGNERVSHLKLSMWDKFISAEGFTPALIKFAVAASIVGGTVYMAGVTGVSDLSIYNGLGQTVLVDLDGDVIKINPHSSKKTDLTKSSDYEITTKTLDGQTVEIFQPELSSTSGHYVYNVAQAAALFEYRVYYGGTPGDYQNFYGNQRWLKTNADYIFEEAPEQLEVSGKSTTKDVLMGMSDLSTNYIMNALPNESQQIELIKTHTLWDPSDAPNVIEWVTRASTLEDANNILRERLKLHPDEILTLRLLMDSGDESIKSSICKEYETKVENDPSNATAYYISTRCLPFGLEKENRYIKGAEKWPNHGWMNYAASHYFARQNKWQKSYDALQAAYDEGQNLKPVIGLNAARIHRLIEGQGKTVKNAKQLESPYLEYYKLLEAGNAQDPYIHVHYLVNTGALQEAMDLVETLPDIRTHITAVCAASDGGKQAWIDTALDYHPDSLSELGVISVVGLRLRKNMDISAFEESLEGISKDQEFSTLDFIDNVKLGNYSKAHELMSSGGISTTGQMCVLAHIAYGSKIPADWTLKAQTLLFPSEKPYFKSR
jgi:hypothetical protein